MANDSSMAAPVSINKHDFKAAIKLLKQASERPDLSDKECTKYLRMAIWLEYQTARREFDAMTRKIAKEQNVDKATARAIIRNARHRH